MKPPKLIDQIARSWCYGSRHMQRSNVFASWRMISRHCSKPGMGHVWTLGTPKNNPYTLKMCLAKSDVFCSGCKFWPLQAILLLAYCSKNEQLNLQRQAYFAQPKENVATKIQQISANFAFFFVQPCTFYMLFHLGPSWCYLFLLPCDPRTRQIKFVDDFKGRVTFLSTLPLWSQCTFSQAIQENDDSKWMIWRRAFFSSSHFGSQ